MSTNSVIWRDALAQVKRAVDKKAKYSQIASNLENLWMQEEIDQARQRHARIIADNVYGQNIVAIEGYKNAIAATNKAQAAALNRFDPAKLAAEMTVFQMRVNNALKSAGTSGGGYSGAGVEGGMGGGTIAQRLEALANEAKASGDIHKMRAWGEVATSLETVELKDQNDRQTAFHLANSAHDDLRALTVTPETQAAQQAERAAYEGLIQVRNETKEIGRIMGATPVLWIKATFIPRC